MGNRRSRRSGGSWTPSGPSGKPAHRWTASPDEPLVIEIRELTDGGQEPMAIAAELAAFIAPAQRTLELALYDVRLVEPEATVITDAVRAAALRGVAVRVVHNVDHDRPIPVPPPPQGDPDEIA